MLNLPAILLGIVTTQFSEYFSIDNQVFILPFGLALILFSILMLMLVIALIWNANKYEVPDTILANHHEVHEPAPQDYPLEPDDLTVIEGIGPQTAAALHAAGVTTFDQLVTADPQRLAHIIDEASLAFGDPSTWSEQAKYAAQGDWRGLKSLQDDLDAGRRTNE